MSLLEIDGLHTKFHTPNGVVNAVHDVDLEIEPGEIVGLVGESGSGKSVLAQSVMGLIEEPGEIAEGDIRFEGESLLEKSESEMQSIRGGSISIVFQDPMNSLNPIISVGEQIAENVRLHQDTGESVSLPAEIKRKILGASKNSDAWLEAIRMLETVGIPDPGKRATDYPSQFSGGMRQRAMIAIALSAEPDLMIADEPTTALDVTIQAQILDELRNLQDEFNTSILFITHDLGVVAELCEKVNVMYAGEIVERGSINDIFQNPSHPYTQGLLKSTPRIEDPREEISPIPGSVPQLIDMPEACYFAPRCPEATEECLRLNPDFRQVGSDGHEAACIHRDPVRSPAEVDEVSK